MRNILLPGEEDTKRPNRIQALNSEQILPKEQLFDVFQQILGVKKFEHQLLYNALQVLLQGLVTLNIAVGIWEANRSPNVWPSIFIP